MNKIKCPVCNVPLEPVGDLLQCPNDHCGWVGNAELWTELIKAKQELEETKKALHRDWKTRNDCLTKILESYLNFAGFVRAYPRVPNLPTFRAGNIIYDWSPVLELMKNGRTDRALERLKAIEPDQICPKCGKKMTETMLLSLPPQTQYKCWECGYTETKGNNQ